ncbi:GNAT family N-acetyltransferase, partial [Halobacteriales archaeon QH_7_69_31]
MERRVLGWPPDGPTLRLDHRRFSYAGKFVMTTTGKAVLRDPSAGSDREYDDAVVAAVAFDADRTDPDTLWLRYVTVCDDRRGEGLGPRLCAFVVERAADRGYDRARIAVNNPFAYEALYRAGFGFTGRETGLAELVLERPTDAPAGRPAAAYREGLDRFRERDLPEAAAAFL